MAGPADVIHDLVAPFFLKRFAHPRRDIVEHFVPTDTLPFTLTSFADALQGITYAIGIGDLVERRRSLGAIAATTAGMLRIALEAADTVGVLLDEREQTA